MPRDESKGHAALRRGRVSIPGASYFLTFCTDQRLCGLTTDSVGRAVTQEAEALEHDSIWRIRAITIMPDHVHGLIVLGQNLSLPQVVARFKAKTNAVLKEAGLKWERGYFDHRIRPEDKLGPIVRYIENNPIRAGLVAAVESRWPWFKLGKAERKWFRWGESTAGDELPDWLSSKRN